MTVAGAPNVLPRSAANGFEILRQNGYRTAFVGKLHMTPIHEISSARNQAGWGPTLGAGLSFLLCS